MKKLLLELLCLRLRRRMKEVHPLRHLTAEDWAYLHDKGLYEKLPPQLLWVRTAPDPTVLQRVQCWLIERLDKDQQAVG